jgi:hypothetical protein
MGVGLFCGILGLVSWSALAHRAPEMSMAYRNVAIPAALCCGTGAFLWNLGRVCQAAARKLKRR